MGATSSAKDPSTGGSSSPRRSRPRSRLAVRRGITSSGSSATTGLRSAVAPATGFGGWSISPPAAPVAGRKRRGQRGRSPPPAPPGDTRSVATGDSPPFVNGFEDGFEGGAVTPPRVAGRAGQCVAGRTAGCRPSLAPGRARRWSQPRSAQTSSKGITASPRRPLSGFEGTESLASPGV